MAEVVSGHPAEGPAFAIARALLADKLARYQAVRRFLDEKHEGSPLGRQGQVLKAADLERRLSESIEKSLDTLGLTAASAGRLASTFTGCESAEESMPHEQHASRPKGSWSMPDAFEILSVAQPG